MRRWCALLLGLGLLAQFSYGIERLPVQAFASLPELQDIQLSPDGQKIAGLLNVAGNTLLFAREVTSDKLVPVVKTDNKKIAVNWFRWANNERILISARFPDRRYGVATMETRLMSVRYDGSKLINLLRPSKEHPGWVSQIQDRVVDWLPADPEHVLVAADLESPLLLEVFQVDVNDGARKKIRGSYQADMIQWIVDRQQRVRVGVKFKDTHYEIIFCDPQQKEWRTAWSFDSFSDQAIEPIGFGGDPNLLYVSAYHDGRESIFTVDLTDPKLPLKLKYADPNYDVDGDLIYSEKAGDYIGIVNRSGDGSYLFWQPEYQALANGIDAVLPGTKNRIIGFNADEARYLLFSSGNKHPGVYYFGDRNTKNLSLLGSTYPKLQTESLAGKKIVRYKARDGIEIQGYLTLSSNAAEHNLPTIIFPHGGPIASDDTDFDYWTEFFANRGYAVLQMDFRGSGGYGHDFMTAGLKQWGLQMQDDVVDGTRWLIEQGIADKDRICIVGASYGGYAALMGAVKSADLYRCAISFAGVSDLRELVDSRRNFRNAKVATLQIGSSWSDREQLKATSPRLLADQIKMPILLVHGTKDRSVPFEQSEQMAAALKSAGKPYQFIVQEDGDHFLSSYEQRLQLFEAMDKFLATYLGTSTAVVPSNVESL
ncbi:MAG TPA: S9 family peptidase [Spongiibacteraceae bacterium]|nr:S9 family peptidase [Spongiibacteraceae bacterium]